MVWAAQPESQRRRSARLRFAVACSVAGALLTACDAVPPPDPIAEPQLGEPVVQGPPFPRTAVYFLEHEDLPTADTLARYDVVVLDSEWDNRLPPSFFGTIRQRNPDVILLAYVNVVDRPPRLGSPGRWADRYALWQFVSETESRFPPQWLARAGDGTPVSEYPDTTMTNLTDQAPRVNGRTFAEYLADWMADQVWSTGIWDGIFLDVWGDRIYGASHDHWDIDGDGTDEPESEIYGPGKPWERGIDAAERLLRARMSKAILVANGDRTLRGGHLDGRVWESFADPQAGRDPLYDMRSYVTLTAEGGHRRPGLAMTINQQRVTPGSPQDYRRGRFFLTATLLQDGYWSPMGEDYGELAAYDELVGGGLGPGYLGYPYVGNPTSLQLIGDYADGVGEVTDGLLRRDFEHGIVLVNTAPQQRTVTLERPYRRLRGVLDPATNNGQVVRTVSVPPRDGLVLLRTP